MGTPSLPRYNELDVNGSNSFPSCVRKRVKEKSFAERSLDL